MARFKRRLQTILGSILDNPGTIEVKEHGICSVLYRHLTLDDYADSINWMREAWADWPRYSGSDSFPVANPWGGGQEAARQIFQQTENLWTGIYGDHRFELCRYLLTKLEKEAKANEKSIDK